MELGYGTVGGRAVARVGDGIVELAPLGFATLDRLLAAGPDTWRSIGEEVRRRDVRPLDAEPELPVVFGDVVDFYASLDHATNMGRILRPGSEPLLPNWRHLPVGYHSRAGGIAVSGTPVRRPEGLVGPGERRPTAKLDFELEVGFVVGVGNDAPVAPDDTTRHLFGAVLVNDWSARDIQAFEYQPLGPLLGKSFLTSVSPWIVPLDALPRIEGPVQDPPPDAALAAADPWSFDVDLLVELNGTCVTRSNLRHLYWTVAQMFAHLTSNGSRLRTGDLLATGTVSGPAPEARGCLLERTWNGTDPLRLDDGATRTFLEDGDTVVLRSSVLGECTGTVKGA